MVEDMMITFGEALDEHSVIDGGSLVTRGSRADGRALAHAVVDLSGRPQPTSRSPRSGHGDHAFQSLAQNARITLHVTATGENDHQSPRLRSRPSGVRSPKPSLETARSCARRRGRCE